MCWGGRLFLKGDRRLDLFCFTKLLTVPFEGVLVEAYKGIRRKHKMKFRQIGHTTTTIKQLSDKMDEFTSTQSEMSATLANMKATITVAVKDELAAIRPSLNRQIADEVQNQLSSSVRNTEVTNATDIQKMIRENLAVAREIEKRRLNLMVYRLNESADAGTGTQYDIDLVRKVLSDTDIITNASITRAERIGKPDRSKTRPLRITVQDQASRLQILRNAQKVKDRANFKEIAIAPDRTLNGNRYRTHPNKKDG